MHLEGSVAGSDTNTGDPVLVAYHVIRTITWSKDDGTVGSLQSYYDESDWENRGLNDPVAVFTFGVRSSSLGAPATGSLKFDEWFADQLIASTIHWDQVVRV